MTGHTANHDFLKFGMRDGFAWARYPGNPQFGNSDDKTAQAVAGSRAM
jgi:hypothetical protein